MPQVSQLTNLGPDAPLTCFQRLSGSITDALYAQQVCQHIQQC